MIAIRIAPTLLEKIRRLAVEKEKPNQSLLHELLKDAVERSAA
jgi:predicted DNA binding CopG/RHH family protein